MTTQGDFYLFLNSGSFGTKNAFTSMLYQQFVLVGDWECALCNFSYTPSFQGGVEHPLHLFRCSMCKESGVNNTGYQVLRWIPVPINTGGDEEQNWTFPKPYCVLLSLSRLNAITVIIKNERLYSTKLMSRV